MLKYTNLSKNMETYLSFYIGNFCLLLVEYPWDHLLSPMRLQKKETIDRLLMTLYGDLQKNSVSI